MNRTVIPEWFLILLIPYVVWAVIKIPGFGELFWLLFTVALIVPIIFHRIFLGIIPGAFLGIIITPVLLVLIVYLDCRGNGDKMGWLDLAIAYSLTRTAPIWIGASILIGIGKGRRKKAEQDVAGQSATAL